MLRYGPRAVHEVGSCAFAQLSASTTLLFVCDVAFSRCAHLQVFGRALPSRSGSKCSNSWQSSSSS